ncbi:uncharacterized protein LOC129755456 [Uranotaenia lowii]|uniref:uncharacterized protein LOC129754301 n=1 Tax=Uranotaenia lowii TaxID=190385 RepID=UPI00247A9D85|nr:uncharacterized protein LOC129754301 [Uranotaenia lowii]XP_055607935.1 uncharacterized protein LOC129755456 [Uranotaenia lowii]
MAHLPIVALLFWLGVASEVCTMHIPEDMEILEGYELESAGTELNPEDDFYERRSLLEPFFYRAIRDKREIPPYRVLESPGLKSHFRPRDEDLNAEEHNRKRNRRSTEVENVSEADEVKPTDQMPKAEKHTMGQRTIEAWAKTPYQVQKPTKQESQDAMDSEAEASMMSDGIKARAPRVNFITQKKSISAESSEAREDKDKIVPELYRKPLNRLYYDYPHQLSRVYDSFPAYSNSPMYPKVYNKYDEFHRDMMDRMHPPSPHRYDTYYQRRYDNDFDPYFPRYSYPSYYYYPDKRFDVPYYYRDRNHLLTNDVMDTPYVPPPVYIPSRNRRIIYYATLPEVVRTPPNVRLHNYVNKYGSSTNTRYDSLYPTKAPYKSSTQNPDSDRKDDKYVSSTPIKIVRDLAGQEGAYGTNSNNNNNNNNSGGRRQYQLGNSNGGGRLGDSGRGGNHYLPDQGLQDRSYFGRYH